MCNLIYFLLLVWHSPPLLQLFCQLQLSKTYFHVSSLLKISTNSYVPQIISHKWPFFQLSTDMTIRKKKKKSEYYCGQRWRNKLLQKWWSSQKIGNEWICKEGGVEEARTSGFIEVAPPDIKNSVMLSVHSLHLTPAQKKLKKTVSFQRMKLINCGFYTRDSQ